MVAEQSKFRSAWGRIRQIGPGIAIAATGVGAADLVSSTVAGSRFGMTLVWAIAVGAMLKYTLNEGVARWHLATGTSVLQGWARYWGRPVLAVFFVYLLIWSFVVAGGLIVASGLAAHSVIPWLSRESWGVLQSVLAMTLVLIGSYQWFERLMKVLVALMFFTLVGCAVVVGWTADTDFDWVGLPDGSLALTLGLAGGVGGSVTMLVYGYWIEEKKWESAEKLSIVRTDLAIAYTVTGLLAVGAMLLASEILLPQGIKVEGQQALIQMAMMLEHSLGGAGRAIFLAGFWGAAFSSLLGVLQGVPYLFADLIHSWQVRNDSSDARRFQYHHASGTPCYRIALVLLGTIPMLLLFYDKPIWIVVIYAAVSSLFLPLLATALLVMNNRKVWVGTKHANGISTNVVLCFALALFAYLAVQALQRS